MWRDNSNWSEKGEIKTLPGKLCCVFWQNQSDSSIMNHIGFYIGGGWMIHCSGTVKKERLSAKCTHWAIPRGLGGEVPVWRPTIRRGSKGEDVTYVQTILAGIGYDLGTAGIDGVFGRKTEEAVKAFQRANGLNPDGVVGPLTYTALEKETPVVKDAYTAVIPNLTKEEADKIKEAYPNATITVG